MADSQKQTNDFLTEILARLPVKSLQRLRSVSRSCCTLIKSHSFINSHTIKQHRNGALLLVKKYSPQDGDVLCFYDRNCLELGKELRPNLYIPFVNDLKGENECNHFHDKVSVLGPCNGLVCIFLYECYMFCNPTLRDFKKLPPHDFSCPKGSFFNNAGVGFGVSHNNIDNYKVVLIGSIYPTNCYPIRPCTTILLYNSCTNLWRQITDDPVVMSSSLYAGVSGFFLKGSCHWNAQKNVLTETEYSFVLTFDITTEVFGMFEYSDSMDVFRGNKPCFMVYKECLALAKFNYRTESSEIWVMKEYGLKESWTKQYEIGPKITEMGPEPTLMVRSYLCFKNEGCLLVQGEEDEDGRMAYYDFHTNDYGRLHIQGGLGTMRALIYKESLVNVNHVLESGS